jgi:hypothetical protein
VKPGDLVRFGTSETKLMPAWHGALGIVQGLYDSPLSVDSSEWWRVSVTTGEFAGASKVFRSDYLEVVNESR